jgi:hypothetical protein
VPAGVQQVTAGLPEHRLVLPDRGLAAVGGEGQAEDLLGRVADGLRVGGQLAPGPVRPRGRQVVLREQGLVVDHREVVHQGRDAEHLAVDGRDVPLAGGEVVPAERRLLDDLGQVDYLGGLGDLRHVGAVLVRDVRLLAALQRHRHLLQRVVVVDVLHLDVDLRVQLGEVGDQALQRLVLRSLAGRRRRGVAHPEDQIDDAVRCGRACRAARTARPARGREQDERERSGHAEFFHRAPLVAV